MENAETGKSDIEAAGNGRACTAFSQVSIHEVQRQGSSHTWEEQLEDVLSAS